VVAGGTAHHLDRGDRHQITLAVLVDRSGRCAHRVTDPGGVALVPDGERPAGRLLDLLLRSLGCPTAPPEHSPRRWWDTAWLDAVVAEAAVAPGALRTFADVVRLHPLVDHGLRPVTTCPPTWPVADDGNTGWAEVRRAVSAGPPPIDPAESAVRAALAPLVDPATARWMDDGCLARWLLGDVPPFDDLLTTTDALLPGPLADQLRAAVLGGA
jgi:hypothetical protein